MIITTPMMQQNWDNTAQLGQMMDDNAINNAVSPSSMLFGPALIKPDGYSYQDYWAEQSLAWDQMMTKPFMSFGSLIANSASTILTYAPVGELMGFPQLTNFGTKISDAASAAYTAVGRGIGTAGGSFVQGMGHVGDWAVRPAVNWIHEGFGIEGAGISNPFTRTLNKIGHWYQKVDDWNELRKLRNIRNESAAFIRAAKKGEIIATAEELAKAQAEREKAQAAFKALREAIKKGKGISQVGKFASITARMGGAAAGFVGALFNPVWLAKQAVLDTAIEYGMESYENYSTLKELEREALAKGGRILRYGAADDSRGIDGGFTTAQRKELSSFIDRLAGRDERIGRYDWFGMGSYSVFGGHKAYTESLRELKALFSVATDMGMLDMSKSLDEVEKRFESLVKIVKKVSRITGKSKGELAAALAATQQTEGRFNINDAGASLERKIYAAAATGANLQTVLMESQMGAQLGMQSGLGRTIGADIAAQSRLVAGRMIRHNALDQKDIWAMGGEQGLITKLTAGYLSAMNNSVVKQELAMMIDPRTGRLDTSRIDRMQNASSADLISMHHDRWRSSRLESINELTGRREIGGILQGRMPFVDRALQRGDISAQDMMRLVGGLVKQQMAIRGTQGQGEMLHTLIQMFNGDVTTAMTMWAGLKDDKYLKADAKEKMDVAMKHIEDRFSSEYSKASTGMLGWLARHGNVAAGSMAALGAVGLGFTPVGWGAALVGLGTFGAFKAFDLLSGSRMSNQLENWYLGIGANAMTPEMAAIHAMGYDGESGISVYKRMMQLQRVGHNVKKYKPIKEYLSNYQDDSLAFNISSAGEINRRDVENLFYSRVGAQLGTFNDKPMYYNIHSDLVNAIAEGNYEDSALSNTLKRLSSLNKQEYQEVMSWLLPQIKERAIIINKDKYATKKDIEKRIQANFNKLEDTLEYIKKNDAGYVNFKLLSTAGLKEFMGYSWQNLNLSPFTGTDTQIEAYRDTVMGLMAFNPEKDDRYVNAGGRYKLKDGFTGTAEDIYYKGLDNKGVFTLTNLDPTERKELAHHIRTHSGGLYSDADDDATILETFSSVNNELVKGYDFITDRQIRRALDWKKRKEYGKNDKGWNKYINWLKEKEENKTTLLAEWYTDQGITKEEAREKTKEEIQTETQKDLVSTLNKLNSTLEHFINITGGARSYDSSYPH